MTGDDGTAHVGKLREGARDAGFSRWLAPGSPPRVQSSSPRVFQQARRSWWDLTDNNVNEEGGFALAGMLFKQPNLKHVNLEATSLGRKP